MRYNNPSLNNIRKIINPLGQDLYKNSLKLSQLKLGLDLL
jgi:hypothetical protein